MISTDAIRPPRTILEAFKSLPEGTLAQLIENNIVMSPAPFDRHQLLVDEIYPALSIFIRKNHLGACRVAPYDVYLDAGNVFQPDICFVSNKKIDLIKEDGLHGAPDLVIEILSPGTAKYDLTIKKAVYERCGVKELWYVDPEDKEATGYYLINGKFDLFFTGQGKLDLKLLPIQLSF